MKIVAMSDLHLSKKPWQVRKALKMGEGADVVLLAGDLVNDGTPEQMKLMHQCIAELLPDTPVFAVTGNHDYPRYPSPMIPEGVCDYPSMQDWLLSRQPYPFIQDSSGAYAVSIGDVEVIGLNAVSHWRRFVFHDGAQLKWLASHLDTSRAKNISFFAMRRRPKKTQPYLLAIMDITREYDYAIGELSDDETVTLYRDSISFK